VSLVLLKIASSLDRIDVCQGGNPIVHVESVSVTPTSKTLNVAETVQLVATVLPTNTTNKTVSWGTSNASIATVNSTGLVTSVTEGLATITVKTTDGSITVTSAITVNPNTTTTISIEENTTGFCSVDGTIDNNNEGFTGKGGL